VLVETPRALKLRFGEPRVRVEYRTGEETERVEFPLAGLGDNPEFARVLRACDVQTIHTLEATLEDVFVRVTGRSLR